jgi:hypothetical protein
MRNILLILLVSCLPGLSFSQLKAEDVKTIKDMDAFLDAYYFKGSRSNTIVDYYTDSVFRNSWNDEAVLHYFDSLNTNHWVRMDLNSDKKADLIWNGCMNGSAIVLAFLSNKEKYDVETVSMLSEFQVPHVIKPYDKSSFILCRIDVHKMVDTSFHFKDRFGIDTITYSHGIFTDYNVQQRRYRLDTFKCRLSGVRIPNDSFTIYHDQKIYISKRKYENGIWKTVNYYKRMTQDSINLFFSVMNNLPYYSFRQIYNQVGPPPKDGISFCTEFIFDDKTRQKLFDHLLSGPYGLRTIFNWLLKLRRDSNWIFISEKI